MIYFHTSLNNPGVKLNSKYAKWCIKKLYFNNIAYVVFCYIMLLKICYPLTLKLIAGRNAPKMDYVFLYKTFIFDKNGKKNNTSIVGLIAADKEQSNVEEIVCVHMTQNKWSRRAKEMATRIERVPGLGLCRIEVFLMNCIVPSQIASSGSFGMSIGKNNAALKYGNNIIEFQPTVPDYKNREVVICMSRVMTFERWQLVIASLELYKLLKVDLVVTHVQSALKSVFELMKIYEKDGILSVRPGIRFPFLQGMPYNPNEQTEFNGQIILAHECFYEFREKTTFIALIDWDDLLVTTKFQSLGDAFSAALSAKPTAGYLLINKLESTFNVQDTVPSKFNVHRLLRKSIMTAFLQNNEKMVVIPKRINSFWMHYPRHMEDGLNWLKDLKRVTSNYSFILHLANEERVYPHEFNVSILQQLDLQKVKRNFDNIWDIVKSKSIELEFPRMQVYFDSINVCHGDIFNYLKYLGLHNIKICLTYSLCKLPKVQAKCMVAENEYQKPLADISHSIGLFVRKKAYFVEKEGCDINGRV